MNDKFKLGMTRAQLVELMGEPDAIGGTSRKYKHPMVFNYDGIEFHFGPKSDDGLIMIYTEVRGEPLIIRK